MTHAELVRFSAVWLRKHHRCSVMFTEIVTRSDIIPDAIGWQVDGGWSVLIECKVSRSDFRRDAHKRIHLDPDNAPGQERWYVTPVGMLKPEEIPAGWCLAECSESGKFKKIVKPPQLPPWEHVPRIPGRCVAELPYLLSALRRHDLKIPFDSTTGRFRTIAAEIAEQKAALLTEPPL